MNLKQTAGLFLLALTFTLSVHAKASEVSPESLVEGVPQEKYACDPMRRSALLNNIEDLKANFKPASVCRSEQAVQVHVDMLMKQLDEWQNIQDSCENDNGYQTEQSIAYLQEITLEVQQPCAK